MQVAMKPIKDQLLLLVFDSLSFGNALAAEQHVNQKEDCEVGPVENVPALGGVLEEAKGARGAHVGADLDGLEEDEPDDQHHAVAQPQLALLLVLVCNGCTGQQ